MPVLGCGAQMSKLMDVSDQDVSVIEDVIAERLALGVSQAVSQRQAVDEALAQLADERTMVMKAIEEQLGKEAAPDGINGVMPKKDTSSETTADVKTLQAADSTKRFQNLKWEPETDSMLSADVGNGWSANIYTDDDGGAEFTILDPRGVDFGEPIEYASTYEAMTAAPAILARRVTDGGLQPGDVFDKASSNGGADTPVMSNKAQTETPQFKKWFGDSKVVDADGKPLVVYHGTGGDFNVFNMDYADREENWSFSTSKEVAQTYKPQELSGDKIWAKLQSLEGQARRRFEKQLDNYRDEEGEISESSAQDFAAAANEDEPRRWAADLANAIDGNASDFYDQNGPGRIVEAYLSLKNPIERWFEGTNKVQRQRVPDGVPDGYIDYEVMDTNNPGSQRLFSTVYHVNSSEQIKSATGNNGDFDEANPDIRFANKARPAPLAEETQFQKMRRIWQDQYVHVEAIQNLILERGGTVGEQQNVYRAEERMHGRAQEKLIDFGRDLLTPLTDKAAKYGIDLNELAAYAYAKHAEERNDHIDTINPKMQGSGSGMDNGTAASIMQMVQLSGDQAKFDELQQDLMKLTEATRQEYLKSGLISQADYDAWTDTYKNYVPLRGFENVDSEGAAKPGVGSGLSVDGKEGMKALGRRSRAADIIENIVVEHERAVLRGERNLVAKTFLNMAQTNPDPALWEVQPRKITRSFDKKRNLVVYNQAPDTADSVGAKVGGQQVYVKVKDPLLLQALTNSGRDKKGAMHSTVVEYAGLYTNLLRNTLTRYNPVFGAINAVRDLPMGGLATYDALGAKGVKLYAKYYASAVVASGKHEWRNGPATTDMDRWLKEMRLAGGTTSGVFMRDVNEIKSELRTVMLLAGATPKGLRETLIARTGLAVKAAKSTGKVLEWMGATSEDAGRLAAYRAARELGKTPAEAASIAKNLTTNFNRSGEWGPSMNGLYMFFNAGVQGTTKLAQMLANKKVRYVLAAGTAAAMAIALANVANGGDDDDGVPYWDLIPDYEKERNLIIMLPPGLEMDGAATVGKKGKYLKIPVQYGLNIFMNLGYNLAGVVRNMKDPARGVTPVKAGLNMVSSVFGSINPFGGAVDLTDPISVGMALAPTGVDTAIQQMAGVNGFGKPVGPEKSSYETKPDSETFSASQAGSGSQRLAEWMNSITGGNQYRSGFIDVMPGTLDNAARNTAGGLGVFLKDVFFNLPVKYWSAPELITPKDKPFFRNFYADLGGDAAVSRSYDYRAKVSKESAIADGEKDLEEKVEYTPEQEALQSLDNSAKQFTKRMAKLRKEEIEIALDTETDRRAKALARRRLALERSELAKEFNSDFVSTMDGVARAK